MILNLNRIQFEMCLLFIRMRIFVRSLGLDLINRDTVQPHSKLQLKVITQQAKHCYDKATIQLLRSACFALRAIS